jgi:hypothetical protein
MYKPHCVSYDVIKVAEVHLVPRFIEAKYETDGYSRTVSQISLIRVL